MKNKTLILFLILFSSLKAQTLETDLLTISNEYGIMGMSVYVNVNGEVFESYTGFRDFARQLPVTEDTHYRIASVSKSFTALGIMKLYDAGEISLDDDISTAIGYMVRNPNFPNVPITYRMLLSHTSSLQDGSGYSNFLNATYNETPIPNISQLILPTGNYYTPNMWRNETPGTYFTYSNLNFGLLGTLIESIRNQRFDVFMKEEILEPLTIEGSFNIQDLLDINNLSVLYRYNNGWQEQWDNYLGIMPPAPNLNGYIPGTNGIYFAPQGGLRTTAAGINKLARAISLDGSNSNLLLQPETYQLMKSIAWDYNGSNGDNYFGLFNRWGLGLHHANLNSDDEICSSITQTFIGHPGEAYGLVSDNYFIQNNDISFSVIINGVQAGYETGASSFYTVEASIFEAICNHINQVLGKATMNSATFILSPNPASSEVFISLSENTDWIKIQIRDVTGKILMQETRTQNGPTKFSVSNLHSGMYFVKVSTNDGFSIKKLLVE